LQRYKKERQELLNRQSVIHTGQIGVTNQLDQFEP
jgi:hypothetical protein